MLAPKYVQQFSQAKSEAFFTHAHTSHYCVDLPPVDDAALVHELQARHDLGTVEARPLLVEAARLLDVEHQVAAVEVFHHEEEVTLQQYGTKKR